MFLLEKVPEAGAPCVCGKTIIFLALLIVMSFTHASEFEEKGFSSNDGNLFTPGGHL